MRDLSTSLYIIAPHLRANILMAQTLQHFNQLSHWSKTFSSQNSPQVVAYAETSDNQLCYQRMGTLGEPQQKK